MGDEYRPNPSRKAPRLDWTPDLHQKFERAFSTLNSIKRKPRACTARTILALMDVPDVTIAQVQSHLQAYKRDIKNGGTKIKRKNEIAATNSNVPPQQEVPTEPIWTRNVPDAATGKALSELDIIRPPGKSTSWPRNLDNRTLQPHVRGPRQSSTQMDRRVSDDSIIRGNSSLAGQEVSYWYNARQNHQGNESDEMLSTALPILNPDAGGHHQYQYHHGAESREIKYYEGDELDAFISAVLSSPHRDANLNGQADDHQGAPNMLPQQHPILPAPVSPSFSVSPYGQIRDQYHQGGTFNEQNPDDYSSVPTGSSKSCYDHVNGPNQYIFSSTPTAPGESTNQSCDKVYGENQIYLPDFSTCQGPFTGLISGNFVEANETFSNFPEMQGRTDGYIWNGVPNSPLGQRESTNQTYARSYGGHENKRF